VKSVLHVVESGFGFHPNSYTMDTGGSFPRVKRPGREGGHTPAAGVEARKMWLYTSTPPYAFVT
jgi:hypothetical protein